MRECALAGASEAGLPRAVWSGKRPVRREVERWRREWKLLPGRRGSGECGKGWCALLSGAEGAAAIRAQRIEEEQMLFGSAKENKSRVAQ